MDSDLSRRSVDHRRVAAVCLHVAASNADLLSLLGSDADAVAAGLNPLAYAVRMAVVAALKAAAQHIDDASRDLAEAEAVRSIGREVAALAKAAVSRTAPLASLDAIRHRLAGLGFDLGPRAAGAP